MSYTYLNIVANESAYVSEDAPNTNYHGGTLDYAAVAPNNTHRKIIFCRFPGMLSSDGKIIGSGTNIKNGSVGVFFPYTAGDTVGSQATLSLAVAEGSWDYRTVTFNNRPSFTVIYNTNGASNFGAIPVTQAQYEKIRQNGVVIIATPDAYITNLCSFGLKSAFSTSKPSLSVCLFDSVPIVTPIAPLRRFIDALDNVTFEWTYSNEYADSQKSYALEISTDGVSWTELSAAETSATSVIIPAGTLASNVQYWRIKVVSQSDFESAWSAAIQIIVTSPSVCILSAVTSTPRPIVSWSCEGQQAFQARFGDYETKAIYGTTKTYQCPIYLDDGTYIVSVRTQGSNGLWSQWSSQTITVQNVPGDAITLGIFATHRAKLTWSGGENGTYYVLRDGVPIAKTTENTYTDQFVIGKHTYQVLEQLADGNYTLSNEATATMLPDHAIISPVPLANWQDVNLSRESHKSFTESHTNTIALVHYVGRALPSMEDSGFVDKTMTFDVVFRTQKDAAAFEALRGKIVCCKTKIGRMIIGVLSGYTVDTDRWYSQYSCTITATDYLEAIVYE